MTEKEELSPHRTLRVIPARDWDYFMENLNHAGGLIAESGSIHSSPAEKGGQLIKALGNCNEVLSQYRLREYLSVGTEAQSGIPHLKIKAKPFVEYTQQEIFYHTPSGQDEFQGVYFDIQDFRTSHESNKGTESELSDQEQDILILKANGFRVGQIAERLDSTRSAVKAHLAHVYQKIDAHNAVNAVLKAIDMGYIKEEDLELSQAELEALEKLTPREREVLDLLIEDDGIRSANKQLARRLNITEKTANTHVQRILWKLNANNRIRAAILWKTKGS